MKPKPKIIEAKNPDALWLMVDREEDDTLYAILPDEVEAIRDACNEYIKTHDKK